MIYPVSYTEGFNMKKILSILIFCTILISLLVPLNDIMLDKSYNRYYILDDALKNADQCDVQIYGSCHAYTSFDTVVFTGNTGISSYNMANSCEIIPSTYLRMKERFKTNKPKVAVVEIWGTNAYETYIDSDLILDDYFKPNIELFPLSSDKLEIINDFDTLDILEENIALLKYKERLLNCEITEIDFNYSYDKAYEIYNADGQNIIYNDIDLRLKNRGYKPTFPVDISEEYSALQPIVDENDVLPVEEVLMKYLDKIIELCEENDVELLFYRSPYISTENELRKLNYLEDYFKERNIAFYDLEKEINFDTTIDFHDTHHLSAYGAIKATDFFIDVIEEIIANKQSQ